MGDIFCENKKSEISDVIKRLEIAEAALRIFDYCMYINMEDGSYEELAKSEYVDRLREGFNGDAFHDLPNMMNNNIADNYKYETVDFCTKETVQSSLRMAKALNPDKIAVTNLEAYSDVKDMWLRFTFVGDKQGDDGYFRTVVFQATDITEDKLKEIEVINQMQEQMGIIESIAAIYMCIYYIDMSDGTFFELRAENEKIRDIIGKVGIAQDKLNLMCDMMVSDEYRQVMQEFADLSTINGRLKGVNSEAIQFTDENGKWLEGNLISGDKDEAGNCNHILFALRSIQDEKEKEIDLIEKSNTDELTGLYNRRTYEDDVEEYHDTATEDDFVYVSIDVNELKTVNDTLGHEAGDELIIGAAYCLKQCLGPYGRVYRIGGDEFAAIIFTSREQLDLIRKDLEDVTIRWKGKQVNSLSISAGFVRKDEVTTSSVRDMAVIADKRMYETKSAYYKSKGVDRRGQKDAHIALCALYTKILRVNLTEDTYQIVNMDIDEKTEEKGFSNKISSWLHGFGKSGQVHPDDLDSYLEQTDIFYMRDYFREDKTSLNIHYRRKIGDVYKNVMMEIIPANDYSDSNQNVFLYVKSIDK